MPDHSADQLEGWFREIRDSIREHTHMSNDYPFNQQQQSEQISTPQNPPSPSPTQGVPVPAQDAPVQSDVLAGAAPSPIEVGPSPAQDELTPASTDSMAQNDTVTLSRGELEDIVRKAIAGSGLGSPGPGSVYTEPGSPGETLDATHREAGAVGRFAVTSLDGVHKSAYVYDDGSVKVG